MFETLFKYPRVVARHGGGPSVEARERFLTHCVSQGLAGATLLRHARELLVIAERIDITSGEPIGSPAIEAADCWTREQHHRHRVQALQWSRKLLVQTATTWLHFLGCLEEPQPKTVPFADRLADFAAYQRDERGFIPGHHPRSGLAGGEVLLPGWARRIDLSTMFPWKMWTRFWPATESGVGAVSRCLPAPKLCVLSFDMRLSADGVGPASPPGLMARGCSSTKDSLWVLPGRTCSA